MGSKEKTAGEAEAEATKSVDIKKEDS